MTDQPNSSNERFYLKRTERNSRDMLFERISDGDVWMCDLPYSISGIVLAALNAPSGNASKLAKEIDLHLKEGMMCGDLHLMANVLLQRCLPLLPSTERVSKMSVAKRMAQRRRELYKKYQVDSDNSLIYEMTDRIAELEQEVASYGEAEQIWIDTAMKKDARIAELEQRVSKPKSSIQMLEEKYQTQECECDELDSSVELCPACTLGNELTDMSSHAEHLLTTALEAAK